jgi:hypothetical protein
MPGTRRQFAPTVAMQQPIDGTVIDFMPDALLKGVPDLAHRCDLPTLGLHQKRGQELLLFFRRKILPSSASLSWGVNCCDAETVVTRDDCMNGCFGNSAVPCDLQSCPWLDQGIVDNEPALPPVRARIGPHPLLHFCKRQMGCRMGHSCHICFSSCAHPVHSMLLHKPDGWFTHQHIGISHALGVLLRSLHQLHQNHRDRVCGTTREIACRACPKGCGLGTRQGNPYVWLNTFIDQLFRAKGGCFPYEWKVRSLLSREKLAPALRQR